MANNPKFDVNSMHSNLTMSKGSKTINNTNRNYLLFLCYQAFLIVQFPHDE